MSVEDPYALLDKWLNAQELLVVGKDVTRVDAFQKAVGKAYFTEDYLLKEALFVKQVLSPYPHARILSYDVRKALDIPGVKAVITAKDIPGVNQVGYALPDQPLLAEGKVRYVGEVVALVVAEDYDTAFKGVESVEVKYEELPYLLDPLEAMNRNDILIHEEIGSNIAFKTKVVKGDVNEGFAKSDVIVENEYRTHHQDHIYLEPEAALAIPDMEGRITIICSTQYPHLTRDIASKVLGLPSSYVKIITPYVGGGFGGKDDEGPLVAAKAALAAYLTGRPSFLMYSREESIAIHPKREATVIKYKSGASKDGRLQAIDVKIIHDTGAYANRGPFILWRATVHASGPYEVPNARVEGFAVYTNKVYQGSFRGFGNPGIQFAAESQMDLLAEKLGLDPIDFRLKNILKEGSTTITSQKLDHSVGVGEALRKVAEASDWWRKRREYSLDTGRFRRGIGVGVAWHGISTSRGVPDWSNAYVKIEKDGSVTAYTGIVEMGQGAPTSAHVQIISELLGIPPTKVKVIFGTTDAPDTGATHASRGSSIGGIGVLIAAAKLRERLAKLASEILNVTPEEIMFKDGRVYSKKDPNLYIEWKDLIKEAISKGVELSATGYFFLPKGKFDDVRGQGFAYPAFSYMVVISEVEVDVETGVVKVLKVWPALAAGRILNPQQVEGQLEGAAVQGLGYALMENLVFDGKGRVVNPDLTDYVIPTIRDVPEIQKPIYVEDLFKYGPFGAKGVGELALIPMPASVANAVSHALKTRVTSLPLTPERVLELIRSSR
ncbi:MAG: aldehyde oxidase [Zestosphaera tikiterensis]|uniref:Aldehyde oxidase n=1 Tax=Zestosphaera tikiterensis TaxID=1973259 RepID=A0A2R7Y838_9CREN|nr:MAG: aldehyde oxidase [Zestosphaera tikiterensis]